MSALARVLDAKDPPIEEVALAIAMDAYPGLRPERHLAALDAHAERARDRMGRAAGLDGRVEVLRWLVYEQLGFRGNAADYYDPRNSYFNEVLDRRLGIPITLAAVLMALARRLELRLDGVAFPGHFLVRAGGPGGLVLDPFDGARRLERRELEQLARRVTGQGQALMPAQLEPVGPRVMAVRMLFNLQQIYERRHDHARALVVCDRLVDLTGAPFHRRDRGEHALALGATAAAVADLQAYLAAAPEADDAERVRSLLRSVRDRPAPPLN